MESTKHNENTPLEHNMMEKQTVVTRTDKTDDQPTLSSERIEENREDKSTLEKAKETVATGVENVKDAISNLAGKVRDMTVGKGEEEEDVKEKDASNVTISRHKAEHFQESSKTDPSGNVNPNFKPFHESQRAEKDISQREENMKNTDTFLKEDNPEFKTNLSDKDKKSPGWNSGNLNKDEDFSKPTEESNNVPWKSNLKEDNKLEPFSQTRGTDMPRSDDQWDSNNFKRDEDFSKRNEETNDASWKLSSEEHNKPESFSQPRGTDMPRSDDQWDSNKFKKEDFPKDVEGKEEINRASWKSDSEDRNKPESFSQPRDDQWDSNNFKREEDFSKHEETKDASWKPNLEEQDKPRGTDLPNKNDQWNSSQFKKDEKQSEQETHKEDNDKWSPNYDEYNTSERNAQQRGMELPVRDEKIPEWDSNTKSSPMSNWRPEENIADRKHV